MKNLLYSFIFTIFILYNPFLAAQVRQNPVGAIPGTVDVSSAGAAHYSIPLEVVPGTLGMQPNLSVFYNSQSGMGLLGMKWNLGGLSAITRIPQTPFYDENTSCVNLSASDRFALDGMRLQLVQGSAYGEEGAEYAPEIEDFSRIKSAGRVGDAPEYFEAVSANGMIMEYGKTPDSRQMLGNSVLAWMIGKITDPDGNSMDFFYSQSAGEIVIDRIEYTKNERAKLNPYAKVTFHYTENLLGKNTFFVGGHALVQSRLLEKVSVWYGEELVREYLFHYEHSHTCRLKEIVLRSGAGGRLNSTFINWGQTDRKPTVGNLAIADNGLSVSGDFNGDGYTDVVYYNIKSGNNLYWKLYEGNAMGTFLFSCQGTHSAGYNGTAPIVRAGDFNKDGKDELLIAESHSGNTLMRCRYITFHLTAAPSETDLGVYNLLNDILPGDFNADGKCDILLWTVTGFASFWGINASPQNVGKDIKLHTADFNGNGKTDFQVTGLDLTLTYEYNDERQLFELIWKDGFPTKWHDVYYGDFNGDGKEDLLCFDPKKKEWSMWIALGNNKYTWPGYIFPADVLMTEVATNGAGALYNPLIADIDGDGKDDIVQIGPIGQNSINLIYSQGFINGNYLYDWRRYGHSGINSSSVLSFRPGDYNNDGKMDLLFLNAGSPKIIYFNRNDRSDYVTEITDGFDKKIQFSYKPVSAHAFSYHTTKKNRFVFYVTDVLKMSNGIGDGFNSQTYRYAIPYYSFSKRAFLGFGSFGITDNQTTRSVQQNYTQHIGKELLQLTSETVNQGSLLAQKTWVYGIEDLPGKRFLQYVSKEISKDYLEQIEVIAVSTLGTNKRVKNVNVETRNLNSSTYTTQENTAYIYTTITLGNGAQTVAPYIVTTTSRMNGVTTAAIQRSEYKYSGGRLYILSESNGDGKRETTISGYTFFGAPLIVTVSSQDCVARTVSKRYDPTGRFVISETNPVGHVFSSVYDPKTGNVLSTTDENNLTTTYSYDGFGNLLSVSYPGGTQLSERWNWYLQTDIPNAKYYRTVTGSGKSNALVYYDKLGREVCRVSKGSYTDTRYNTLGQITKTSWPYNGGKFIPDEEKIWNEYSYDLYGRILTEKSPYVNRSYSYSAKSKTVKDELKNVTYTKSYDAAGRLVRATDPGGSIQYAYGLVTDNGRVRNQTTVACLGNTTIVRNDLWGNRVLLKDPDAGTTVSAYNGYGELVSQTDANGNQTQCSYDKLGRVVQKNLSNGEETETVQYVYDVNTLLNRGRGKLSSVKQNGTVCENYTYDQYGRLAKEEKIIDGQSYTHSFTYNTYGFLDRHTYPGGFGIRHLYNTHGELEEIRNAANDQLIYKVYGRNALRQTLLCGYGSNIASEFTYNEYGTLTQIKTGKKTYGQTNPEIPIEFTTNSVTGEMAFTVGNEYQELNYRYNALGLMSFRGDKRNGESFQYDPLGRLTSHMINNIWIARIGYDDQGNILSRGSSGAQLRADYLYEGDKPHAVTRIEKERSGNNIPASDCQVQYTMFHQPELIEEDMTSLRFYYGADHRRAKTVLKKGSSVIKTKYFVSEYEKEITPEGECHFHYIYGERGIVAIWVKISPNDPGTPFYVHTDHLGSYDVITDAGKNTVERYSFDVWGNRRDPSFWNQPDTRTHFLFNRGFTGHEHLDAFRIIHMNGRLYDPVIARFFSPDPYVQMPDFTQNYNRYSYCFNNPLMYTDPSGEFIWVPVVLGAVFGMVQGAMIGHANGAKGGQWAGYILGGAAIGAVSGLAGGAVAGAIGQGAFLGAGIVGASVGGAVGGAISGFGYTTMATGSALEGVNGLWKGAVAGLAGGVVGSSIGGGIGAFAGGATSGLVGSALNGGKGMDLLYASLIGSAVSFSSYQIQQAIGYAYYKKINDQWNYRQFYKISVATQRSFAWGREAGGWILDHGKMGKIAYGGRASLTMPPKPDNASEWFHTHPNWGKSWVESHSSVDINVNNTQVKLNSYVIGRQNVYFQRPMGNSLFLYSNTNFNPYPYYNFNFWFGNYDE